ncbi:MAG: TonB family protein [Candidatus Acidiferrum sp.]
MNILRNTVLGFLVVLAFGCGPKTTALADTPANAPSDDAALSSAICPIVYPLDQSPSDRGFHYTFYGNAFFINNEGYLLTAAHVLSQLSDAQPYIVLRLPMAPPRLLEAKVIAIDRGHDVALLQATPNPFEGKYQVRFLPLALDRPAPTQAVLAAALRPSRLRDPHTFDAFVEDRPSGQVLEYEFSQLEKGRADTELLLFSHEVLLGDSGAPVVSAESQAVVGLVEGRWLRANAASLATAMKQPAGGVGAAVLIHYAIPLLQQQGVAWHTAQEVAQTAPANASRAESYDPAPLSLVAAPFPSQALQGGEVMLDALVDRNGQLADIKIVQGTQPFLEEVLSAVRTWSFLPARRNGAASESRIGIVFQFAHPAVLPGSSSMHQYEEPPADAQDRAALPMVTTAPQSSTASGTETSVMLSVDINDQGEIGTISVLRDAESLGSSIAGAVRQWQFAPGKRAGANCDSTLIIVVIPRRGAMPAHAQSSERPHALVQ